jgi:hypothetical protein
MSLSCALWATSLHQWARRYTRITQPARCSPEKRARMRAFFANGVEKMHITWAVEGLPTLLHLSLFLFFWGLVIYLNNVDQEVFICVVSWIVFFSVVYGLITLLPLIRQDSPYYSPLSILAWVSYASIRYVTFRTLIFIDKGGFETRLHYRNMRDRYRSWMSGGVEKNVEEVASEQSWTVDAGILGWTISALGDDDSLEKFFEAIPGFFNSKLVKGLGDYLPIDTSMRLFVTLDKFLGRTMSSNSVIDSVKLRRLGMSVSAMNSIHAPGLATFLKSILFGCWELVPKTVEIWHTLAPWCTSNDHDIAQCAQGIVAKVLWTVWERDDRWFELAARIYGLPERDLRQILTHGHDNGTPALLIHLTRRSFRSDLHYRVLEVFTQIDIRNTLLGLQHDFCALWNEIVQEAKKQEAHSPPVHILRGIRHLYITLHQNTDAAPTAFSPSTYHHDFILFDPSSYPLCDIADHLTKPSKIRDSSQSPTATSPALPVHAGPRPADASPPGVVDAALQDITPAATLTTQRDIVAPCTESGITQILSTASFPAPTPTPTLVPVPASTSPVLFKSSESCDAVAASIFDPLLTASSAAGFSIPSSHPPSRARPLPNAESLTLLSSTTPPRLTCNATPPCLRARGLVNTGSMCFANAVLQLLVHSPPFWNVFRELGDLKGSRGERVPETADGATPLVDATMRFFEEFRFKEKNQPPPPELLQQVAGTKMREDEEKEEGINAEDSFKPMYMYNAVKEKTRLKTLLVPSRAASCCN